MNLFTSNYMEVRRRHWDREKSSSFKTMAWEAMRKRNFSLKTALKEFSKEWRFGWKWYQVQRMKLSLLIFQTEGPTKSQALIHYMFCPHQDILVPRPFAVFAHLLEAMLLTWEVSPVLLNCQKSSFEQCAWWSSITETITSWLVANILSMCLIRYSMKIWDIKNLFHKKSNLSEIHACMHAGCPCMSMHGCTCTSIHT